MKICKAEDGIKSQGKTGQKAERVLRIGERNQMVA